MNIFSSLKVYAGKWSLRSARDLTAEEIAAVSSAKVVSSQYGASVCFMMVHGGMTFIPLSEDSKKNIGEEINLKEAKLLTLEKEGENDIYRVKA